MTHSKSYVFNKKSFITEIVLLLVLTLVSTSFSSALEYTKVGNQETTPPKVTAESAILYSKDLDEIIFSKSPDLRCDPYSITKLMTAYLAAEILDLDKTVTISKKAANDRADGSTIFLQKGEKVTVEELLYGTLLASGNDAAYALAEAVAGNELIFTKLMNNKAEEWGCQNTHFVNATGYKAKGHYTTANDLIIITRNALSNETVRKIAFTRKYKMPVTNKFKERILRNHTTLIRKKDSGVLGGKTGYWDEKHCTVALEYSKDELNAILILLKDTEDGRDKDAKNLLKFAHETTPGYMVAMDGESIGSVWVKHGARTRVKARLSKTMYAYPPKQIASKIHTKRIIKKGIVAPIKKGDIVGKLEVYVKGEKVGEEKLFAAESINVGWFLSYFYISNAVTACLVLMIVLFIALIFVLRAINKNKRNHRTT